MIKVLKHIENVELSFDKEKIIPTLTHLNSSEKTFLFDIPLDVNYNENWIVSHDCECKAERISFSKNKKQNWNLIDKLFSRFYKMEMLEKIAEAFDSLHVFQSEKSKFAFLTEVEFSNQEAAIYEIPQENFNFYHCENCLKNYLCRLAIGSPRLADRNYHEGLPGRLIIHEIVEFEFTSEDRFSTFEKNP